MRFRFIGIRALAMQASKALYQDGTCAPPDDQSSDSSAPVLHSPLAREMAGPKSQLGRATRRARLMARSIGAINSPVVRLESEEQAEHTGALTINCQRKFRSGLRISGKARQWSSGCVFSQCSLPRKAANEAASAVQVDCQCVTSPRCPVIDLYCRVVVEIIAYICRPIYTIA